MSQNPSGPNFNPNPYGPGPNPMNPNYPVTPGTAYGSSQPSPQPPPGPNPNPNTPNSSYPAHGNPNSYAPPPPAQTPYSNPPTPLPPTTGPNLYDPYAPTAMSQQQLSSPGYQSYPGYPPVGPSQPLNQPPPMPQPPLAPQKKSQLGLMIALVIAVILVIGGSIFGVLAYNNSQNTQHANATATAQSQSTAATNARLTVTAQTATAIASTYPFSNNLVLSDPLVDNTKGENWDTDSKFCTFSGSAYHVFDDQAFTYQPCFATNTNFSNFTFQVEMVVKQGTNNPSAGLIFRATKANNKLYRFVIDVQGACNILVSVDTTGTNTRNLKDCQAPQFNNGLDETNILGVVANKDQIAIYVNQQLVTSVSDSTLTSGQIGLEVENSKNSQSAEAVFTNAKVWQLPS